MYDMDDDSDDETWKQTLSGVNLDFIKEKYSYLHSSGEVMDNSVLYNNPGFCNKGQQNRNAQQAEQYENLNSAKNGCSALMKNNTMDGYYSRDYNCQSHIGEHREANSFSRKFDEGSALYKTAGGHSLMEINKSNNQNQINSTIPQNCESMQFSQMLVELDQIDKRTFHPEHNVNKVNGFQVNRPLETTYSTGVWHF